MNNPFKDVNDLQVYTSSHFLYEPLPKNLLESGDEEDILEFIGDHLWEPFQYHNHDDVFELIISMAESLTNTFNLTFGE